MPIRAATEADLDDICRLITDLADYEHLRHEVVFDKDEVRRHLFGPQPAAHVVIAETTDEPPQTAGFALYYTTFSTFLGRPGIWLEDLFVRPEHRGHGYGLGLLQHLRTLTEARIEWSVLDWNEPSIRFYRALGAEPVEGWTRYRWLPGPRPAS